MISWTSWCTSWPAFFSLIDRFLCVNKNLHGKFHRTSKQRAGTAITVPTVLKSRSPLVCSDYARVGSRTRTFQKAASFSQKWDLPLCRGKFSLGPFVITAANYILTNQVSCLGLSQFYHSKSLNLQWLSIPNPALPCPVQGKPEWSVMLGDLQRFKDFRPGLPQWLTSKESIYNAGDMSSIPELGRSPEGGQGNPLQYSCLENPMDKGAW